MQSMTASLNPSAGDMLTCCKFGMDTFPALTNHGHDAIGSCKPCTQRCKPRGSTRTKEFPSTKINADHTQRICRGAQHHHARTLAPPLIQSATLAGGTHAAAPSLATTPSSDSSTSIAPAKSPFAVDGVHVITHLQHAPHHLKNAQSAR